MDARKPKIDKLGVKINNLIALWKRLKARLEKLEKRSHRRPKNARFLKSAEPCNLLAAEQNQPTGERLRSMTRIVRLSLRGRR